MWINRHFGLLSMDEFMILYKIYVSPHMEFLYLSLVSIYAKRHQMPREDPTKSNKDGTWIERHYLRRQTGNSWVKIATEKKTSRQSDRGIQDILTDKENIDKNQFLHLQHAAT